MVGLVDLGDEEPGVLSEARDGPVQVELATSVGEALSEEAMGVGDVGHDGGGAELVDVAVERQVLVRTRGRRATDRPPRSS